jgi:alpha-N-arabinofuranosidase
MIKGRIVADRDFTLSAIDRRLFGAFVEHLGRCVYGGIYEPGHKTADKNGFRKDVLALTKELGVTIIRYPGGNFVSGYNWEDGVGPKAERPKRLDLAWFSTETNEFGTNEFIDWCRAAKVEPMLAVNLGTRGPDEARRFVEYCNVEKGTALSDLRRTHGYARPHDVKFWCLGNEMDGPWQIGHKTAQEYGRIAKETAKVMRWTDKDVILAACGSSNRKMATFGSWEYEVLDHCFEDVDFISIHTYFRDWVDNTQHYLTCMEAMDSFIKEVAAICDAVAAKRRSDKRIMLSFDEWNVWYKTRQLEDRRMPGWPVAPKLIEEVYDFQDALMVGGAIITLLNNADRVKAASLAQLVNVIAPIMTETGGPAWRQTTFHPFAQAARLARGNVLRTRIESDTYAAPAYAAAPYLCASVVDDKENDRLVLLALNRHPSESMELTLDARGFGKRRRVAEAQQMVHADMHAVNTKENPNNVAPSAIKKASFNDGVLKTVLQPASWNVIAAEKR